MYYDYSVQNEIFFMVLFDLTLGVDRDRNFTRMIHVHVNVKARTIIDTWIGQQNIFLKIRLHKKKIHNKNRKGDQLLRKCKDTGLCMATVVYNDEHTFWRKS